MARRLRAGRRVLRSVEGEILEQALLKDCEGTLRSTDGAVLQRPRRGTGREKSRRKRRFSNRPLQVVYLIIITP